MLALLLVAVFLVTLLGASAGGWRLGRASSPAEAPAEARAPGAATGDDVEEATPSEPDARATPGTGSAEDEALLLFEEPSTESPDPRTLIADYRETFNRAGAPLARTVDRLQSPPVPAPPSACRELTRRLDAFAAEALPAPFEELTFSLTNALARYREAARACDRRDFSTMRHRLQMGTVLWKRSTADMRAVLAGHPDVFESRPGTVAEAFADLPTGAAPPPEWSFEERSGSSGYDPGAERGKRPCCKVCVKGKPCGNSCISRRYTCRQPPGCAC